MAAERVEKGWQKSGLEAYSTDAILGTLRHYGVALDVDGFKTLSSEKYPLAIAEAWHGAGWKGTGQFARFPSAAADTLWRRLHADRLPPGDLALAIAQLISALESMRAGSPDAPVGERFKELDALKAKVPVTGGKPSEPFVAEVLFNLGDWTKAFGQLARDLAKEGHVDDAEEFTELEGFLFPERRAAMKALVRAAKGEKDEALKDLEGLVAQADAPREARLMAADGLLELAAFGQAKGPLLHLLEEAEKAEDFHFGLEVGERLRLIVEKPGHPDRREILARVAKLAEAHDQAHPHHHHP